MIDRRNLLKALGLLAIPTSLLPFNKVFTRGGIFPLYEGYGRTIETHIPDEIDNGKWYHIAITRNEKSYKFYLDGVKIGEVKNKGQGYEHTKWFCNEIKNKTNKLI